MSELSMAKCYLKDRNVWWRMGLIKRKRTQTDDVSTSPQFRPLQMKNQLRETKETSELDLKISEFFFSLKIGVCFLKVEFEHRSLPFKNQKLKIGVCFRKSEFAIKNRRWFVLQSRCLNIGLSLKLRPRLWRIQTEVSSCQHNAMISLQESNWSTASDYSSSPFRHNCSIFLDMQEE